MGFSRQEYWSGLPFPSPVHHVLSELSAMTRPSWVALLIWAHSLIELDKAVVHVINLVSFLWFWFSSSALWWIRIRALWKLPDGRDWLRGKLGLVLMGGPISKSLIQFYVDGQGCVLSLLIDQRPHYGGGDEDNGDLPQNVPLKGATLSASDPAAGHRQPTPPPETPRHSWACLGQLLVGSLLLSPGSWCTQVSVCARQESVSPALCKFWWFYGGVNGDLLQEGLCYSQVCCTQSPCGRPLLTRSSTGDPQTQFWLSLCGLGMHFMPFPGLSSSGDQVLGEWLSHVGCAS